MQRFRAAAPVNERSVVCIGVFTYEYQISSDGALRLGVFGYFPEETIMNIRKVGRHRHAQTRRVGQEDAFFAVEGQSATDLILKIELSQIAAPNLALNFKYR